MGTGHQTRGYIPMIILLSQIQGLFQHQFEANTISYKWPCGKEYELNTYVNIYYM